MQGQIIISKDCKKQMIIPFNFNLNKGIYLLKAITEKRISIIKMIIS